MTVFPLCWRDDSRGMVRIVEYLVIGFADAGETVDKAYWRV
jgi:hypothetical protein